MKSNVLNYLCCPFCKGDVSEINNNLYCEKCKKRYKIRSGIIRMAPSISNEMRLSVGKWEKFYDIQLKNETYYHDYNDYMKWYYNDTYRQLNSVKKIKGIVYLEIGCGPLFLGQSFAKNCELIIGIDICFNVLKIAKKMLDEKNIKNYLLIQGDILQMPIKDNSIDLLYGGGVIEHFKQTQKSVNELYRILRKDGVSFNTVPYLNIGSLTYRQLWGNIPNLPLLKQFATFVHATILGGKHLTYGYELSFLGTTLKKIHKKAGFSNISIKKFEVTLHFEFIPKKIRRPFMWLANNSRLFWPMVKVVAVK